MGRQDRTPRIRCSAVHDTHHRDWLPEAAASQPERLALLSSLSGVACNNSSYGRATRIMAIAMPFGRFLRFIRSIITPMTTILAFATLLTWMFILYQPTNGPGNIQRLGWQAWESVSMVSQGPSSDTEATTPSDGGNPIHDTPEGVDWWNVTSDEKVQDTSSFPLDKWLPLLPHDTGREYELHRHFVYPT